MFSVVFLLILFSPCSLLFPYTSFFFFFFNDTATTEIYTLSLHDALPISTAGRGARPRRGRRAARPARRAAQRTARCWGAREPGRQRSRGRSPRIPPHSRPRLARNAWLAALAPPQAGWRARRACGRAPPARRRYRREPRDRARSRASPGPADGSGRLGAS